MALLVIRPRIVRSLAILRCLQCPRGLGMVVWGWPLEPWELKLWLEFKLSFPLVYVAVGRRGSLYLCCGTGCSASEVPAGLCWAEQDLASLMALEAWPEGLAHCPCRVTARQSRSSPVHMFLCHQSLVALWEGQLP